MKILRNNVLIKPDPTGTVEVAGVKLYLDTRFEEYKNAPQSGTVVALPERLTFSHDPGDYSLDYEVDMELQVGDRVIFNYNARSAAIMNGMHIGDDMLVRYDMIYAAIRDGQVICINGTVIVEPENEEIKTNLIVPESLKNKKTKLSGIVRYASETPHRAERFKPDLNPYTAPMYMGKDGFKAMKRFVKPGDRVLFHFTNAIPLQHYFEIHGVLSKTMLYRMKHTDIDCILEKSIELEAYA